MNRRFTQRDLLAIEEALDSRLAGPRDNEDDPEAPATADYESALDKIRERLS